MYIKVYESRKKIKRTIFWKGASSVILQQQFPRILMYCLETDYTIGEANAISSWKEVLVVKLDHSGVARGRD
jgi:hypothetical protein